MVQLDGANYFMCDLEFKKVGTAGSAQNEMKVDSDKSHQVPAKLCLSGKQ